MKEDARVSVMICDEDRTVSAELCEMIEGRENIHVISEVFNGSELTDAVIRYKPDVLIMDIVMSTADSIDVLEQIGSRIEPVNIPVIMILSSVSNGTMVNMAMQKGAAYYMQKPADSVVLVKRIKELSAGNMISHDLELFTEDFNLKTTSIKSMKNNIKSLSVYDMERMITSVLIDLGVPAHVKGYRYLRRAIIEVAIENDLINRMTKELYPRIAEDFGTTPSRVERAIRNAIDISWIRCKPGMLEAIFGYTISDFKGKPTNSEFIAMISDRFRLDMISANEYIVKTRDDDRGLMKVL